MVPAPSCPNTWDYWTTSPSYIVDLTCLLPNSVYIPITPNWDATLHDVKEELWMKAARYPLFGMLHEMSDYVFQFINSLAVLEEVNDENKRLRDIKPTFGVLKIVERSMRPGEQFLNMQISHLIGKGLNEFDNLRSSEVNDFRTRTRYIAEESLVKRARATPLERLRYQCPPRLAKSHIVHRTLQSHLSSNSFFLSTTVVDIDFATTTHAPAMSTPKQHIEYILHKKVKEYSMRHSSQDKHKYVLKVAGREEYLLGDHPLIQFLYIQETLLRDEVPHVMIVNIDKLSLSVGDSRYLVESRGRLASEPPTGTMRRIRQEEYLSSWSVEQNYTCTVQSVGGLNVDTNKLVEVVCQAGIFHGGKPICEPQKTTMAPVSNEGVARWDQALTFPIKVLNIPRMARLCFVIYSTSEVYKSNKSKKGKKDTTKDDINKLAWANTMIFDYKNLLRTDGVTLFMWTYVADETQDEMLLHPLGTVVSNPSTDSCAALQVRFSDYECPYQIMFPSPDAVRERAEFPENGSPEVVARLARDLDSPLYKDPLYEMHELEKKDIWASRKHFRDAAPQLLSKLLACVEWGEQADSASVAHMMSEWPMLPVESALELLDYAYADAAVRSFAVKCLAKITDEELLLYLLQLVQALKHESYLMCDLALFLLQRAFNNMTIGHFLFWHLRSEMHVSSVSIRFGLVLEAYCRGSQDHVDTLLRQISCLDKLKWLNNMVRKRNKESINKARAAILSLLQEDHCRETLCNFVSPLNPSFVCKSVRPEKCKVMDSKMRPLQLEFENIESCGPDIRIILKIGDDLRQDMFTLQMLRIMDSLWKNEGYDFRLNPYNCISLDNAVGMIEVVDEAETVANIQKAKANFNVASTISKANLFQWLRDYNQSESSFNKAVEEFTMSCAGYCVATYVMGIADRHPDNIMVKKNGQLFHIDFGHFLGHFKQKFGFKRERVPFVLTHDFIHVVNKGERGAGVNEPLHFKIFREHCETAFKILRRHGHLILSLFSMMISTGLPELKSEKDLQYLRDTLVLDLSEEKALEHFRLKFTEAVKNTWMTSFNWAFHNFDKNN
ncbi:phosphatidylinositol 4,5-bisphosphate 3-kinase catalytic subunit delta isoform [Cydia strobilella]|uniref:phosphatidylinositol 4,5-bisphosphate 3-kinase catalytic subunit delta isoform n=1 Tax=Cydia strobilella TaxID=1100964 RepID=UPI0030063878